MTRVLAGLFPLSPTTSPTTMQNSESTTDPDPFDTILNLEEDFYAEGYQLGLADGTRQGRLEGRALGLEKGFEKHLALGRIQGRAAVWAARLAQNGTTQTSGSMEQENTNTGAELQREGQPVPQKLPPKAKGVKSTNLLQPLANNPRLEKHIQSLKAIVDPGRLSMQNTDEAVADVDARLKRARLKVVVIERIIGEVTPEENQGHSNESTDHGQNGAGDEQMGESNVEDVNPLLLRR